MFYCIFMLCLALLLVLLSPTNTLADEPSAQQSAKPELTIQASSTLPHQQPGRYGVANLTDGDVKTAWCENEEEDGVGEWIQFHFSKPTKIERIGLIVGFARSRNVFQANNRVKAATISIDGAEGFKTNLRDSHEMQMIEIPTAQAVSSISITIDEVYRGGSIP